MKPDQEKQIEAFKRISTGVPGLDEVMKGGFLRGGIYLITGVPGSGKTILANQIGFKHVESGKRALYVTLLAESHGRLFGHLRDLDFFDETAISESFNFISAYQTLEKEGLEGLLKSIAHLVRQYKADLLFLDGVASAEELANSPISFKKFVHDLNTVLSTSGCTAVLLSSFVGNLSHPEHTMVDGIIGLTEMNSGMRSVRQVEVMKLRGSDSLRGRHVFTISDHGITVFPRLESRWVRRNPAENNDNDDSRLSSGVEAIDELLKGGLVHGSVTALLGAAGTGKTTLATRFLAEGVKRGEGGIYLGFYETPARLVRKFPDLKDVRSLWQPPAEHSIDEVGETLISEVMKYRTRRVVIDGVQGLKDGMIEPERLYRAMSALVFKLRALGVTTMFAEETELFPAVLHTTASDHSAITDNIIYFKQVDLDCKVSRYLSVIKSRDAYSSGDVRRFHIKDNTLDVDIATSGVDTMYSGSPRRKKGAEVKSLRRTPPGKTLKAKKISAAAMVQAKSKKRVKRRSR